MTDPATNTSSAPPTTSVEGTVASSIAALPPAHEAIRYWFNEKRGRRTGLARLLGLTAATVSSWGRADNPARPHEALYFFAIQEIVGIPVQAWLTPDELAALEPVLQNIQPLVVTHRRDRTSPRQLHFDDALARLAHASAYDPQDDPLHGDGDPEPPPPSGMPGDSAGGADDFGDVPAFDVDAAL